MGLTDRLAYEVVVNPRQAVAGFGQVGKAAEASVRKADAELARLQKRIDSFERSAAKAGRANDPLGADIARIKAADLRAEMDRVSTKSAGLRGSLASVGIGAEALATGAALGTAALVKYGVAAAFSADKLATAQRGSDAVFGRSGAVVRQFAEDADQDLGISEQAAISAAAGFGNLFVKAGNSPEEAAKLAQGLTALTSVLAAAHPEAGNVEDALVAVQAALRGEFDPLEKFKVKVTATAAEQKALKLGLAGSTAALTEQDKQLATLQLLFEKTNIEQGLFAKNTESLAFEQQQATAAVKDFKDALGGELIEDVSQITGAIAALAGAAESLAGADRGAFKELFDGIKDIAGPIAVLGNLAGSLKGVAGAGKETSDVLDDVNALNVEGRAKALSAGASVEEQAASLKKVASANRDALSAAEKVIDSTDRVTAAKKAVAEAADDEAEKAEKVASARRGEEEAARGVFDAEQRLAQARREAPRDLERAGIAARDAARAVEEAEKERDKQLRRRGEGAPKTIEAQDRLASATLDSVEAQERLNELRNEPNGNQKITDAVLALEAAEERRGEAARRTNDALAVNPYEAQQKAAGDLRDAEQDRLLAVSDLQAKLQGVTGETWKTFDAAKATRGELEAAAAALAALVVQSAAAAPTAPAGRAAAGGPTGPGLHPTLGGVIGGSAGPARTVVNGQFNGAITVVANDPAEIARKLAEQQRLANLVGGLGW